MQIDISTLKKRNGNIINLDISEKFENIEGYPDVLEFLEPVNVKGTLMNANGVIILDAKAVTEVLMLCSRCLSPVKVKLDFKLNEKFSNTNNFEEDVEVFFDDLINIDDILNREIILNLPMKVVCREDCKGLCPTCGKNLNDGSCNCKESYINPKFKDLRALFNLDEEV